MSWDPSERAWKQARGLAGENWDKQEDDDLAIIAGQRDELMGLLQERYGITRAEAENFTEEWRRTAAVALSRMQ